MKDLPYTSEITENGLLLRSAHQADSVCLTWTWLRDHCQAAHSLSTATGQKIHTPIEIVDQRPPDSIRYDDDQNLYVIWSNGAAESVYSRDFLEKFAFSGSEDASSFADIQTWDAEGLPQAVRNGTEAQAFLNGAASDYTDNLTSIAKFGLIFLRNAGHTIEETEALANKIAFVAKTFYGEMGVVDPRASAPADSAWSNEELGPHTDGTYFNQAPGLQALHCLEQNCVGGESTLVDGFRVAQAIQDDSPDLYAALRDTVFPARFIDDGLHYETNIRILRHIGDRLVQVQYNCYDRAPVAQRATSETFYKALARFHELSEDSAFKWEFKLKEGDALIFDNWRILHGRRAFAGNARKMASFYIDRDAYQSAVRVATGLKIV